MADIRAWAEEPYNGDKLVTKLIAFDVGPMAPQLMQQVTAIAMRLPAQYRPSSLKDLDAGGGAAPLVGGPAAVVDPAADNMAPPGLE